MKKRLRLVILIALLLSNWILSIASAAELKIEKTLTQADGLASNTVLTIFEDDHGAMWFGTTDGLTRYDGKSFRTFTVQDGLADDTVSVIFQDRQGMLWFGTGASSLPGRGVSRYNEHEFQNFTTAHGLASNTVKDILEDGMGRLWFATGSPDGVSRYDGENFDTLLIDGPMGVFTLPEWWNVVETITQDTAGNLWFGSQAGISYYNVKTSGFRYFAVHEEGFTPFVEMGNMPSARVTDLQFDTKQNLWITQDMAAPDDSGVRRYDGKELISFPRSEELPMSGVKNILLDSKGNLWFSSVGVSVYDGKTFQHFNTLDGLPNKHVWSVFEDSGGKLWFATDAGAAVGVYLPSQNADN